MRKVMGTFLFALAAVSAPLGAQTIMLTTDPPTAGIWTVSETGIPVQMGTGSAKLKLRKESVNRVWLVAEGYDTTYADFPHGKKYPKSVVLSMDRRLVKINALPYDVAIFANGKRVGTANASIPIPRGQPVTVEVKKAGFKTELRTYRFETGADLPPAQENFELKDRAVTVHAFPSEANVSVDGNVLGKGSTDVVVPYDKCVNVTVFNASYSPKDIRYCNKSGLKLPEIEETVTLDDRLVTVTAAPSNSDIKLHDKVVGRGSYDVIVPKGGCTKIEVIAPGYAAQTREFCSNPQLAAQAHIELAVDEAYSSSVQSDQANVNFTIEVGTAKTPDQAWRVISQVILSSFDVLEITDKETGYMRTAWEATKFSNSIVRTRVIVKLGDTSPLKYVVKIASEHAPLQKAGRDAETTVKDDQDFREWDRIMNVYKDIINELQARLR